MKTYRSVALVGAVLLAATAALAQPASTSTTPTTSTTGPTSGSGYTGPSGQGGAGLLGQNFTDIHLGYADYRHSGAESYNAGIRANQAFAPGLDLGLGYDYHWENNSPGPFPGTNYDAHYHKLDVGGTFYTPIAGVKPFLGVGIGYQWARTRFSGLFSGNSPVRFAGDEWIWKTKGGVEVPLGPVTLTPHFAYIDTLSSDSHGEWQFGAEANYWFTPRTAGYFDMTFHNPRSGGGPESWTYVVGARVRF